MRTKNSKVMLIANKLVAQGHKRAYAMIKAWALVKMEVMETKVSGVSYGNRQTALEHLTRYDMDKIKVQLKRVKNHPTDRNAVAVVASVQGKGSYTMGYLPKYLAAVISPLIDKQKEVYSRYKEIRGKYYANMNYGLRIEVKI